MIILQSIPEKIASINFLDGPGCTGREGFDIFNSPVVENRKTRQNVIGFICLWDEGMNMGFILRLK